MPLVWSNTPRCRTPTHLTPKQREDNGPFVGFIKIIQLSSFRWSQMFLMGLCNLSTCDILRPETLTRKSAMDAMCAEHIQCIRQK